MQVEVVNVGDELLRGATVNTNAAWLGEQLLEQGVDLTRITIVPDEPSTIVEAVLEARDRVEKVIVTGGLGPTHDDRTMPAIASAFDRDLIEHPEARRWVATERGYDPDELTPGTLDLPEGARFLPNDVGIAPGAVIDGVYVLPGVPEEMKAMFGHITDEFIGPEWFETFLETEQPEREIADPLKELETRFDVSVGSYPGKRVQVRISSRDEDAVEAAEAWLRTKIDVS